MHKRARPTLLVRLIFIAGCCASLAARADSTAAAPADSTPTAHADSSPSARADTPSACDSHNATITRDDWGIAHVNDRTDADAVFGMMYAQAEDDFNRIGSRS